MPLKFQKVNLKAESSLLPHGPSARDYWECLDFPFNTLPTAVQCPLQAIPASVASYGFICHELLEASPWVVCCPLPLWPTRDAFPHAAGRGIYVCPAKPLPCPTCLQGCYRRPLAAACCCRLCSWGAVVSTTSMLGNPAEAVLPHTLCLSFQVASEPSLCGGTLSVHLRKLQGHWDLDRLGCTHWSSSY